MKVIELWRYPVKSLQGEQLPAADVDPRGLRGDREHALFDARTGLGLTARRVPELLLASARTLEGGGVEVVLPDGTATDDDAVLSDWLGRAVELRAATEAGPDRRYENPDDAEDEVDGAWHPFRGSAGAFHDAQDAVVSLLSRQSLDGAEPRRFRANVLLDGGGEDDTVGGPLRLGGAVLDVALPIARCVMVTRPQPGGLERDLEVLRWVHRERGGTLAVGATVSRPGRVAVGDEVAPG